MHITLRDPLEFVFQVGDPGRIRRATGHAEDGFRSVLERGPRAQRKLALDRWPELVDLVRTVLRLAQRSNSTIGRDTWFYDGDSG